MHTPSSSHPCTHAPHSRTLATAIVAHAHALMHGRALTRTKLRQVARGSGLDEIPIASVHRALVNAVPPPPLVCVAGDLAREGVHGQTLARALAHLEASNRIMARGGLVYVI